jgi:tetratricopeptide (TPR) repeat protein
MVERDPDGDAPGTYETPSSPFELLAPESEEKADSLRRALRRSKGFSLHVVIADGTARREILRRLRAWSGTGGVPRLYFFDEGEIGARAIERWLAEAWEKEALSGAVLPDGDALVTSGSALSALNVARDRFGQLIRGPFVVVLSPRSEAEMATIAPDLFDIRAGTWEFEAAPASNRVVERSMQMLQEKPWPEISKGELQTAAARLRALSSAEAGPPPGALADAWLKLGRAFFRAREVGEGIAAAENAERNAKSAGYRAGMGHALLLKAQGLTASGRPMDAERSLREALDRFREAGDVRALATGLFRLAGTLRETGRYDEALTMLEAALNIFRDLHEDLECARTRGRMADVYQTRGQLDEALRVRREEELPVYVKLGDDRQQATTWNKIAFVLMKRGNYDDAFRICTTESLPIYERLNDPHGYATTYGLIADILQNRGQLEDAIQIYTQIVLPSFEALGDVRNRATAWGRIAKIYRFSGRLDEAIRILREEELPMYMEQNKAHHVLATQMKLADLHLARGMSGDREEAAELLRHARASAENLRVPELEVIKSLQSKAGFGNSDDSHEPSGDNTSSRPG